MTTKIFKYKLDDILDRQDVFIPAGAQILSACEQDDRVVVYALVYPESQVEKYEFKVIDTGQPIPDNMGTYRFLNTVKLRNGSVTVHVFVKK
jgi:hypothetical protein